MDLAPIRRTLLHWAFPLACLACREDLPRGDEGPLCRLCRAGLAFLEPPFCLACAEPGALARGLCPRCESSLPGGPVIRALFHYRGPAVPLVHAFKFSGRRAAARAAGAWMGLALARFPELAAAEALVPVPLHPGRERERGYNQALLLAQGLSEKSGLPVEELLERRRPTRPSWFLGRRQRAENLAGAFAWAGPPGGAAGRRLLVIDDVCTSTATIAACARTLRQARASWVAGYALARQARERTVTS